ncbi:MAG TPA: transketolase family protein [Firmicutes bacterium]|nr:transketolase family protein [Bacillota bacterium]
MKKMIAQREAYGEALLDLGKANPNVVVLDADVSNSTRTVYFAEQFPGRFFNFGIAEQNMMAAAAGMAKCGLIPFVNTFSFLATYRAADQLRTSIVYPKANVKIAATYGGLSDSFDGPTHQSIADLAWVRALPDLTVVVPADAVEVRKALPVLAEVNGPVWLRLSRNPSPVVYGDDFEFTLGKAAVLREGTDVTLMSCGTVLERVLEAAARLVQDGVNPRVVSISTLKPIDKEAILAAARETGAIVTVEEHNIVGGLGAAVSEVVADQHPCPVKRVGIPDTFADTGPYDELLDRFGLAVDDIVQAAKAALALKKANGR